MTLSHDCALEAADESSKRPARPRERAQSLTVVSPCIPERGPQGIGTSAYAICQCAQTAQLTEVPHTRNPHVGMVAQLNERCRMMLMDEAQ